MRLRHLPAIIALLLTVNAVGQDIERPVQRGVKTTEPGAAIATSLTIPIDDMASAAEAFARALNDLHLLAEVEGFTVLGVAHIAALVFGMPQDGQMPFELRLLIAEQPTQEDYDTDYGFKVMELAPQKVAFTFHKGALDQSQGTVMQLVNWVMEQEMQPTGGPEFVMNVAEGDEPDVAEIRLPVQ